METLVFEGQLSKGYSESDEALVIDLVNEGSQPLADLLENQIGGKQVSVRYWITDKQVTREEAQEAFLNKVLGIAEVEWFYHWSDITGYLWTDEELMVGGHDLMAELKCHFGKWLILEIDVHDQEG